MAPHAFFRTRWKMFPSTDPPDPHVPQHSETCADDKFGTETKNNSSSTDKELSGETHATRLAFEPCIKAVQHAVPQFAQTRRTRVVQEKHVPSLLPARPRAHVATKPAEKMSSQARSLMSTRPTPWWAFG